MRTSRLAARLTPLLCVGLAILLGWALLIQRGRPAAAARRGALADQVLYEVHVQSANSCRVDLGSPEQRRACARKIAPPASYKAHNGDSRMCRSWPELSQIRLGTLDDLLPDTTDYRAGITLRYIRDSVQANAVWLMPIFPNNDRWKIPDESSESCDHLGSPYAVRDYMHVSADFDQRCIATRADSCWGDDAFAQVVAKAHRLGMKVYLDLALNHFGHEYVFYDYEDFIPVSDRISRGEDLDALWDFKKTFDPKLLAPKILDRQEQLEALLASNAGMRKIEQELRSRCPSFTASERLRFFPAWREMLDWEKTGFDCASALDPGSAPAGFFLKTFGDVGTLPKNEAGHNYSQLANWPDVDFLYLIDPHMFQLQRGSAEPLRAFIRNREYLFRIVNYWIARGVDGFRLDHTTDYDSGLGENVWKYIIAKAKYYDALRRGGSAGYVGPEFIAEEFHDRGRIDQVADAMIQGYAFEMRRLRPNNVSAIERVLSHEHQRSLIVRSMESHDDSRALYGTGFDPLTAAVFWAVGATTRGTPLILMGQELAERAQITFRRAGVLRERFSTSREKAREKSALLGFFRMINQARLDEANRALRSPDREFLRRTSDGSINQEIFAQIKWDGSRGARPLLTFHLLGPQSRTVAEEYFISPQLARQFSFDDDAYYKLVDVFTGAEALACRRGGEMRAAVPVRFTPPERVRWLRLEECSPGAGAAPKP